MNGQGDVPALFGPVTTGPRTGWESEPQHVRVWEAARGLPLAAVGDEEDENAFLTESGHTPVSGGDEP